MSSREGVEGDGGCPPDTIASSRAKLFSTSSSRIFKSCEREPVRALTTRLANDDPTSRSCSVSDSNSLFSASRTLDRCAKAPFSFCSSWTICLE